MSTEIVNRVKHTPYLDKTLFHLHFPFVCSFVVIRTFRITISHSNIYKFMLDDTIEEERTTQKRQMGCMYEKIIIDAPSCL